jgi:uncharacterized membrane protein YtjA (UPF0391 family)
MEATAPLDRTKLLGLIEEVRHEVYGNWLKRLAVKMYRATLFKTVRGHGVYPRYDVPFLRALRALGWATAEDLAIERGRQYRGWFPASPGVAANWLESARRRRLVERNEEVTGEWGTTERGESRIPAVSLTSYLPIVALLVAAGGFAANTAGVDQDVVVTTLVLVLVVLLYALMRPAYASVMWRMPLAAVLIRLEIWMDDELGLSSVEIAGLFELVEGKPSHLDDAALDRIADAIHSYRERSPAE